MNHRAWIAFWTLGVIWAAKVLAFPSVEIRSVEPISLPLPAHHGLRVSLNPIRDPNLVSFRTEVSQDGGQTWRLLEDKIRPYNTEVLTIFYRGSHYGLAAERNYLLKVCAIFGNQQESCDQSEVLIPRQVANVQDEDNDGLPDAEEYNYGTDPLNPDSDSDDMSDRVEFVYGVDANLTQFPLLSVSENLINVGEGNPFGDKPTQHPVLFVRNLGERPLRIVDLLFQSEPLGTFELADQFRLVQNIPPGNEVGINIDFLPRVAGRASGKLILLTDDRQHFPMAVDLAGEGMDVSNLLLENPVPEIRFQETRVGGTLRGPSFKVSNQNSDRALTVSTYTLYAYNFLVSPNRFEIPPQEQREFNIVFLPEWSGTYEGVLRIQGENDSGFRVMHIPLYAKALGAEPRLRVEPRSIDFGRVVLGRKLSKELRIHNDGDGILFIKYVDMGMEEHVFVGQNRLFTPSHRQLVVPPHSSKTIEVVFEPSLRMGVHVYQSKLCLVSNDPQIGQQEGCNILRQVEAGAVLPSEAFSVGLGGEAVQQ